MSFHLGDRAVASTITFKWSTAVNGVPTDPAGSPAISVYKTGSSTETTTGVTLTSPYDSRTGLANIVIDTSADGTFYAAGNDFALVVTTGTLGGVSLVGCVVGSFSLAAAGPVASVTARVTANTDQIAGSATGATNLSKTTLAIGRGTVTTGATTTSVPTSAYTTATSASVANQLAGRVILFDIDTTTVALRGQAATISASSASATPTLTTTTLTATPASGDTFSVV